jgi:DNA-binding response OmpR family regulator
MRRILCVDDNPDSIEVIKYKLQSSKQFEFEVLEAFSGEEAIEIVSKEPVDIVLLDVIMPRIDGFEVCRRIKKIKGAEFLPVILVTAREDIDSKLTGFKSGADDYISKPFDLQELEARIKSLLHIKDLQDELRKTNEALTQANEDLHVTSQKLVEAERLAAIAAVMTSVNHEINNPLCAIMLNAQLMRGEIEENPESAINRVGKIERNVERIQAITQKIQELKEAATTEYVGGEKMLDLKPDSSSSES